MTCAEANPLLNAYVDGELDVAASLAVEQHLSGCDTCSEFYRKLERLREDMASSDLHYGAGANLERLRARIRRSVRAAAPWRAIWGKAWIPALAAGVLAVAVFLPGRVPLGGDHPDREVVDSHVRSLLSDHLLDVSSSDHHTVKPWFQGKLSFSPPVPDISADGFVLSGGRLDVIAGRPAAALVYLRRKHVINLWIVPAADGGTTPGQKQLYGYQLLRWRSGGFSYWAVSDLNAAELRVFAALVRGDLP